MSRRRVPVSTGLVASLVAVLVTAGAAYIGGTATGRTALADGTGTVATLGTRSFSCTGGLPGGRLLSGTLGGPVEDRGLTGLKRFSVPKREARGAFAVQTARSGDRFAMAVCAEPRNDWWFTAAGASVRHSSSLTVVNPRPGPAVINIEVFGTKGNVQAPGLQGITVPGRRSRTFKLAEVAPANGDLVVHLRAVRGLVSVGGTDSSAVGGGGIGAHTAEWLPDTDRPARRVLLAGLPRDPARADLLIGNPGEVETIVEVELVGGKGPFHPKGVEKVSVPPRTVIRRPLDIAFDGEPVAVRLTSRIPVVATMRSLLRGDQSLATAAEPLHGESVAALPTTTNRDLVLTGLATGKVRVVSYGARGRQLDEQQVDVKADVSKLVKIPTQARYLLLSTTRPVAIAGIVGSQRIGFAGIAVPPAARALRVPAVRPGW